MNYLLRSSTTFNLNFDSILFIIKNKRFYKKKKKPQSDEKNSISLNGRITQIPWHKPTQLFFAISNRQRAQSTLNSQQCCGAVTSALRELVTGLFYLIRVFVINFQEFIFRPRDGSGVAPGRRLRIMKSHPPQDLDRLRPRTSDYVNLLYLGSRRVSQFTYPANEIHVHVAKVIVTKAVIRAVSREFWRGLSLMDGRVSRMNGSNSFHDWVLNLKRDRILKNNLIFCCHVSHDVNSWFVHKD